MMATFPLCAEARHEAAIRSLLAGCVDFVRGRLSPERLCAVVLTGSFARGEGSVMSAGGGIRVLGDLEFFVVLTHGGDYQRLRAEMTTWGPTAAATIGAGRVRASLEFGPVHVGYLRRAGPSIFVHDLRHHGKVLWGPADLLEQIPAFGPEAIPREDALRLLLNRTIEQLEAHERLATLAEDEVLDLAYQGLKVVLDLAGSALAFNGVHCASYAERPRGLARLLRETPSLARRLPGGFEPELARATLAKLSPDDYDLIGAAGDTLTARRRALREQIVRAIPATLGLLTWELEQLVGAGDDLDGLVERYLRAQPLARRLREWSKLLINPLPAPLPLSASAAVRLFARSTPRALIYAAGVRAYRELAGRPDDDADRLLPIARAAGLRDRAARRRAIVALWRWCVRNS
jgi:hypothetical protein